MSIETGRDHTQLQPTCNIPEQLGSKQMPLSKKALKKINSLSAAYTSELTGEARKIARRAKTDDVSEVHVNAAANILFACEKRKRIKGVSGILSGALFGVPLAPLTSLSSISSISIYQYITIIFCSLLGIALAWHSVSD